MKKTCRKLFGIFLGLVMVLGLMPGMSLTAYAEDGETTYTITIPSTLTVSGSGWNATDGISATGTLASGKKLTVTASSGDEFALVNESDNTQKVGYMLATASTDTEAATSWTFDSLSDTATKKDMGIIVENYDNKPAGTYTDTVTFTASVESSSVPVTSITLNKNNTTIAVGNNETLSVSAVAPDSATNKTVTWSSDKTNIATVDDDGKVTAVAAGTANITATANDGSGVKATCAVTVTVPVTSVTINNAPTEDLYVNSTGTLTATVSPNDATDKTVIWSSNDPDYVSINATTGEYEVKGTKGYGSATITATATNGTEDTSDDMTATCTITGKVHHTSLQAGDIIRVGETIYTGDKWYVDIQPNTSFATSAGVITLVEDYTKGTLYYKFSRGSNGTKPNWTRFKVTDNTDGLYIVSGTGTSGDKFVFAVHTK